MTFWACAESYSGSGRPSRTWAEETAGPDVRPDRDQPFGEAGECGPAYPFNGMGGFVHSGPYATEAEATAALDAAIEESEDGWLNWK